MCSGKNALSFQTIKKIHCVDPLKCALNHSTSLNGNPGWISFRSLLLLAHCHWQSDSYEGGKQHLRVISNFTDIFLTQVSIFTFVSCFFFFPLLLFMPACVIWTILDFFMRVKKVLGYTDRDRSRVLRPNLRPPRPKRRENFLRMGHSFWGQGQGRDRNYSVRCQGNSRCWPVN